MASKRYRLDRLERAAKPKETRIKVFLLWGDDDVIEDDGELLTQKQLEAKYPGIIHVEAFKDENGKPALSP